MTEVRVARRADLAGLLALVDEFAQEHPSRDYPRSKEAFAEAYFGDRPAAEIVVAARNGRIIGMMDWRLMFDMFWTMYYGLPDWLFVSSKCRGSGLCLSLFALACERVRRAGGKAIYALASERTAPILEKISFGSGPNSFYHLSNEAFHRVADLAGETPATIAVHLPSKELCKVERAG